MVDTRSGDDLRERPIGELVRQLAQETSTLVRQELDLAKAEVREKGRKAGFGVGLVGAAGVLGLLALGTLTAFFILALDGALPSWAAALIVAAVYGAIAGVLYLQGRAKVQKAGPPVPDQTVETLKEDVEWAKSQTRSARR
jgi:MFS family permease